MKSYMTDVNGLLLCVHEGPFVELCVCMSMVEISGSGLQCFLFDSEKSRAPFLFFSPDLK
jgi:hypothetical protein